MLGAFQGSESVRCKAKVLVREAGTLRSAPLGEVERRDGEDRDVNIEAGGWLHRMRGRGTKRSQRNRFPASKPRCVSKSFRV